jgi:hypothetical protein
MAVGENKVPWILWPLDALWRLLGFILQLTGRIVAALLGVILLAAGIIISLTVIGAVVGVPLALLGMMLMMRAIF